MEIFTKETFLNKVLGEDEIEKILVKHKVPCLSCPMLKFEMKNLTIGQICKIYGIDLENLLNDLNRRDKSARNPR